MNSLTGLLNTSQPAGFDIQSALLSLLVAYLCSQVFAWVYIYTHRGVSYSQSFVQSLILLSVVVCIVMLAVGNNIIVAFGLFGALAIIRFRNILKDTRDTAFLFMMIAIGMTTGTYNYLLALIGTACFTVVVLVFHYSNFAARHQFDGFLSFRVASHASQMASVQDLIDKHCLRSRILTQRSEPEAVSYTMRLLMRDPRRAPDMVEELKQCTGISGVSLLLQEDESEV